eukprot:Em0001g129a
MPRSHDRFSVHFKLVYNSIWKKKQDDRLWQDPVPGVHSKDHPLVERPHLLFKITFFPGLFLFICLYCGMETSVGNLIFTFAVESLDFTKKDAALLNAVFWGT